MEDRNGEEEIRGELLEKCQRPGKGEEEDASPGSISPSCFALTAALRWPPASRSQHSKGLHLPLQLLVARTRAEPNDSLLQTVADDGHFKGLVAKAIAVMQLKLRGLHVEVIVPAGNDRRNRKAAIGG